MKGLVVGALLPPSGSIVTATSVVALASAESTTNATPFTFGTKVSAGAIFCEPCALVHASYLSPRRVRNVV